MMSSSMPYYFDYMATTPLDPSVVDVMCAYLQDKAALGNASSTTHAYGWRAAQCVEEARSHVAALINAEPEEIIWTSGATEANNLALLGAARFYHDKGRHIVTSATEHAAVVQVCQQLEREGFEVTYLKPASNGLIDLATLEAALRPDTVLVSIMHANNEIGVIQNSAAIAALTQARGILYHMDAAQSAGKVPLDVKAIPVDLASFSAHKLYGPKGVGALFVRQKPRVRLCPLLYGGSQERSLRPGTLATHQIVGMGEAFKVAKARFKQDDKHTRALQQQCLNGLAAIPDRVINGDLTQRLPGNISVSFPGVEGSSLQLALSDIALSATSACASGQQAPSHVLTALGLPHALIYSTLRISFGRFTTHDDMQHAVASIVEQVQRLRSMAP